MSARPMTLWRSLGLRLGLTLLWSGLCLAMTYLTSGIWPLARDVGLVTLLPAFIAIWVCDRIWGPWIARVELWKVLIASPALYIAGSLTFAGSFIVLSTAIETLGNGPGADSANPLWLLLGPFIVLSSPVVLGAVGAAMLLTIAGVRLFSVKPETLA